MQCSDFSLSEPLQAEQAAVASEFESYKVRVHNVLKQQKNKSVSQTEAEGAKQERWGLQDGEHPRGWELLLPLPLDSEVYT